MHQPWPDELHFHCSRLTGCKRCSSRREAARARLGTSPRKALDSRLASMSPGPFRRPLPRPCSPPPPPPPPYAPCACATTTETDERPETSEIVEQLLDEFTERIQSFFLALMGFNHPHMERLQAALDQQVKALGRGLMRAMAVKDAFWGLKSAVAESQLWKRLKQCRQRLFD